MARKNDHIVNQEDFQRYLEGRMSDRERHDFEKNILEDDFSGEALEGLSQLGIDEISTDLASLKHQIQTRTGKGNAWIYYRIAAALLLLGVFSFIIFYLIDSNSRQELALTKNIPVEEKARANQKGENLFSDSLAVDADQVIAYQQKTPEIHENPAPGSLKSKTSEPETQKDVPTEPESPEAAMDYDLKEMVAEEEVYDEITEEKPSLDQIEESHTLAPALAIKKEVDISRSRVAAKNSGTKTISGTVMSKGDAETLPGVNVMVKGTNEGTVTDMGGNYSINVPEAVDVVLVYSFIGFNTEEVAIGDRENIDVNIEPDVTALSEIVVTGYASQKKIDMTGAVSSVSVEDNTPYNFTPPQPVGGQGKFKEYIHENLKYPDAGLKEQVKGTVKLKFAVSKNGKISNIEILKSLGEDFDREAIRLVNEGPAWVPAIEHDSTTVKEVTLKIRFRPPG